MAIKRILLAFPLAVLLSIAAYAYTDNYPANAPVKGAYYAEVQTIQLGRVLIIIPANNAGYISQDKNSEALKSITSSTITGRLYTGANYDTEYSYRLSAFNTSQYQQQTTQWQDLTITTIYNTNLNLPNNNAGNPAGAETMTETQMITIFLLGVITICLFMKR